MWMRLLVALRAFVSRPLRLGHQCAAGHVAFVFFGGAVNTECSVMLT